jgi:PAS domain S-box-containing protein
VDFDIRDLQRAIDRDELVPCFQPLVGLHTGRLTGFEVLARWQHPHLGPILPSNFISLAEGSGLIAKLMHQVSCKAMFSAKILAEPLMLSLNISPHQMRDLGLIKVIGEIANAAGFPLQRLMVEITESALLTDIGRARTIAKELKAMGCKLALDDFGTGYSSLNHLQSLPFDELKVDRSFVSVMTTTRESRKIVASIVGLAHSLGLASVGEGVETEEQADMLLWLGCEQGQGWLYGRPVLADRLAEFIAAPPRSISPRTTSPGEGWATSALEALPVQRLAQLQAIYDSAPVGLCFLDRQLRYVSMNQRLAEMNDIPLAAHIGRPASEMFPDLFAMVEPDLLRALAGKATSDVEIAAPPRENLDAGRTLKLYFHPAWDEADEVIGVSVAIEDITERKQIEAALQESADHLHHLSVTNQQEPWIMDKDGNSIQVSSQWVRSSHQAKARTKHLGWLEAVHVADLESTMKSMKHALRTGIPIDIKYRIRDLDGKWTWMRSRGSPRLGEKGEILRWYGTVEVVNQLHRAIVYG